LYHATRSVAAIEPRSSSPGCAATVVCGTDGVDDRVVVGGRLVVRHVRAGLDTAHLDTAHLDTAHLDTAHLDTAHLDTAHLDTAHLDTAHLDTAVVLEVAFVGHRRESGLDPLGGGVIGGDPGPDQSVRGSVADRRYAP
jgi:hypothetical protein